MDILLNLLDLALGALNVQGVTEGIAAGLAALVVWAVGKTGNKKDDLLALKTAEKVIEKLNENSDS